MTSECPGLTIVKLMRAWFLLAQVESGSLFASSIWHMDTSSPSELFWNPTCASLNGTSLNPGRLLTWRWRWVHSLTHSLPRSFCCKKIMKSPPPVPPLLPVSQLDFACAYCNSYSSIFPVFTWETPPPLLERGLIVDTFSHHQECTIATSRGRPLQLFDNLKCFRFYILGFLSVASTPPKHTIVSIINHSHTFFPLFTKSPQHYHKCMAHASCSIGFANALPPGLYQTQIVMIEKMSGQSLNCSLFLASQLLTASIVCHNLSVTSPSSFFVRSSWHTCKLNASFSCHLPLACVRLNCFDGQASLQYPKALLSMFVNRQLHVRVSEVLL